MSELALRDLTVERGGRAVVREVSVEIPAGQVTALLGPNGAGKSTLVLAVGGVLRPKAGSVLLDGTDLTGRRPERIRQAGVAIVPEGRRLLPDLTVEDNLRVASYALSREQAQAGRKNVLDLFPQLGQRLAATARTLSGGEQQMVVLAQALICKPRYMLIDELSLGLAPVVVSRLIPVIRTIAESGTGVLLIEQFATVALGLANHAHIMEGGRIRFSGPATDLRTSPDLLRSAYLLRGSTDRPAAVPPPPAVIPDLLMPNEPWYPLPARHQRIRRPRLPARAPVSPGARGRHDPGGLLESPMVKVAGVAARVCQAGTGGPHDALPRPWCAASTFR
jgi:branched-chain amino acid transport system ATP-binding protein